MDKFASGVIARFREYRARKLQPLAELCTQIGIRANYVTALSLLSGLLAAYFVFYSYFLFLLLALLHLFFDALDGVVAHGQGKTTAGAYFDIGTDTFISFLFVLKAGWYLHDYFAYLVAGLFFLASLVFFISRMQAPMMFIRTVSTIVLIIAAFPTFPFATALLTVGYLTVGVTSAFSLARQLQWYVGGKRGSV